MKKIVEQILNDSLDATERFVGAMSADLILLAEKIALAFTSDRKLLICGNGGSAADAQHIAAEFVNRYELERPPLPAMALTTDTSVLTSVGNDYGFDQVFSKQIKALGQAGDVLLALSTSGNSGNVLRAVKAARRLGIYTAGFTGGDGGKLKDAVDAAFVVDTPSTPRTQEAHALAGHIICHLVDHILFQSHLTGGNSNS
ncbi:MAG: D-sedoheptulose 7-phosphate isomerase [Deltaproteobacteria bacterium]|nr:D-sedoheptulose 7-phosphate isomerase [Deltaproteobacteria bacterium]